MSLLVESTLGLAQLQDGGRFGVRHLGVTQGGALDWVALYWANWLLGNRLDSTAMEIPLGGLTLLCEADSSLALTGADLDARLDGEALRPWSSFTARRGQRLVFGKARSGVRGYLAAPGGFAATPVLGACATVVREGLGGLHGDGRPLIRGDRLEFSARSAPARHVPARHVPLLDGTPTLEVILGAQIGGFAGQSLFDAFNAPWTLDRRADRMGIRLLGPKLIYQGAPLISEGIPLGALQVPPDGQPIALLNDRQTIGGYPRLGALSPAATARLAQSATASQIRLRPIGLAQAQRQQRQLLESWTR